MKRFVFILAVLISPLVSHAQFEDSVAMPDIDLEEDPFFKPSLAYHQGDWLINIGLGTGVRSIVNPFKSAPLIVSTEYGFHEIISAGMYSSYYKVERGIDNINGYENSRYWQMGLRMSVHITQLMNELFSTEINTQRFDLYASYILGYMVFVEDRFEQNIEQIQKGIRFVNGPTLGMRVQINPLLGVYVEGGRSTMARLNVGVSLKW